jgi:hypothetical protein
LAAARLLPGAEAAEGELEVEARQTSLRDRLQHPPLAPLEKTGRYLGPGRELAYKVGHQAATSESFRNNFVKIDD